MGKQQGNKQKGGKPQLQNKNISKGNKQEKNVPANKKPQQQQQKQNQPKNTNTNTNNNQQNGNGNKKKNKKNKNKKNNNKEQKEVTLGSDSEDKDNEEESEDQFQQFEEEVDQEDQKKADQVLEQFAYEKLKKQSENKKQKERKIVDFKFRNMELIDIFIKKTRNPAIFISSIIPYCQTLKDLQKDKAKAQFTEKLSKIVRKFFEKKISIKPEYNTAVDECISEVIILVGQTSKKNISKTLEFALFNLIKLRQDNDNKDKQFAEFLQKQVAEALEKSALKKEINYSEQFFKELFKNHFELLEPLVPKIIKYTNLPANGGLKEHRRKFMLEILNYIAQLVNFKQTSKECDSEIEGIMDGIYTSYKEIKHKKYSDLRKYTDLLIKFVEKSKNTKKLQEKLVDIVNNWEDDQETIKIRNRVLQKFSPEQVIQIEKKKDKKLKKAEEAKKEKENKDDGDNIEEDEDDIDDDEDDDEDDDDIEDDDDDESDE